MKKRKVVLSLLLMLFCMLCLSGCSQSKVDMETTLTLKADQSGNRQIRLSIDKKDFDRIFGGNVQSLHDLLKETIPSCMEWSPSDDEKRYGFVFNLYFSSLEDYEKKVEQITGVDASIQMEQPNSVFASGIRYQENFTSMDLLGWLTARLKQQDELKNVDLGSLFTESSVKVVFGEEEYTQEAGAILVDTLIETPVERIDILTHYMQNKHCNRQIVFTFSNDSMAKNGDAIRKYMEQHLPDGAKLEWGAKEENQTCTVSDENLNVKQLNRFMGEIFKGSDSFVSGQPQQRAGKFASALEWNELIDVGVFSYNGGRVALGYYVQWEDGMEITIRRQNASENLKLVESEQYGGYQKVLEKDIKSESLITGMSTTYAVKEIRVNMEFTEKDYLNRDIDLILASKPDSKDLETIRERIAKEAKGVAEVTSGIEEADKRTVIRISQKGSIQEVNDGYQKIFNVQGQLAHETSGDLMELKHTGSFVDLMDFTDFLENDPNETKLTYCLKLERKEKILEDTISSTVTLKQGNETINRNEYVGEVEGAYLSLTLDSSVWNMDGMMLFLLMLLFILIAAAVVFFARFAKDSCIQIKEKFHRLNPSFKVKKGKIRSDKGQRAEKKKKRAAPRWKKAPFVHYEEKQFEEEPEDDFEENHSETGDFKTNETERDDLKEEHLEEEEEGSDLEEEYSEEDDVEKMVKRVTEASLNSDEEDLDSF